MTRVIHTGDTHLGYRQYHSPERRRDFLAAFEAVIDDAIEADVDAVVHAGDLFHDRQPSLVDVHGTIEVLRTLREASIPFLAIVGNHERTRDQQWLDLFETLGLATRLGPEPTQIGTTAFYGLDYVPRSKRDDLAYDFEPTDAEHAALVAHGLFEPFPHADWDTEEVLASASVDFDAVLLGDNHEADRAEVRDTWVTYCGSTERTSASERESRGYNLVTFDDEVSIRRRSLDTRSFEFVDVDLSETEGAECVREHIREADVEDAVVVVAIDGEGREVPVADLEAFAQDRGALVARVRDRREFESDDGSEVRFVDPDDAVRERLRELEPSEAALALDETIRDVTVADANVRERATDHVHEYLESDLSAFTDTATLDEREAADAEALTKTDEAAGTTGDAEETDSEDGASPGEANATDEPDAIHDEGEEATEDETDTDGQVTMGEYL